MLPNDDYQLLVEAFVPPDGHTLRDAIATTYSLDLEALLLVPAHFALSSLRDDEHPVSERLGLLAALQRATRKLSVYCQAGRIGEPTMPTTLYGLLESIVVPARAPCNGELHAKLWALTFGHDGDDTTEGPSLVRLVILSRNLTYDRSWDVSIVLDGSVEATPQASNRPIADFIAKLPALAIAQPADDAHRARAAAVADAVHRANWTLPDGFKKIVFHPIGVAPGEAPWRPERSRRLVVVSPFVTDGALAELAKTTEQAVCLVSRADELDETLRDPPFEQVQVLHDAAATEDGEEVGRGLVGLHAKLYLADHGDHSRLYLGSANATHAGTGGAGEGALNLELLTELRTQGNKRLTLDEFLGVDGLGALLVPWTRAPRAVQDEAQASAERALEACMRALATSSLRVEYQPSGERFIPTLCGAGRIESSQIESVRARLASAPALAAVDASGVLDGNLVRLDDCDLPNATGFVVFELRAAAAKSPLRFTLSLPTSGIPSTRDAAIVRFVVRDQERFLAYVLALLGFEALAAGGDGGQHGWLQRDGRGGGMSAAGLLERLVRAKARAPETLAEIAGLVDELQRTPEGAEIVPPEFQAVWALFQEEDRA